MFQYARLTNTRKTRILMSDVPTHLRDGQAWLRQHDWRQFEHLVATAYQRQGYAVLPTSPGADGGIDLILVRGPERIFVQCKHWKAWQVGAPVIRELFGLVVANRASRGIVVTSGTFSVEAVAFARQSGTELVDGKDLLALIANGCRPAATQLAFPMAPQVVATPSPSGPPACPVCLSPMVLRRARRGPYAGSPFWGCVRFPGCRGTLQAAPGVSIPAHRRQQSTDRAFLVSIVIMLVGAVLIPILLMLVIPLLLAGMLR